MVVIIDRNGDVKLATRTKKDNEFAEYVMWYIGGEIKQSECKYLDEKGLKGVKILHNPNALAPNLMASLLADSHTCNEVIRGDVFLASEKDFSTWEVMEILNLIKPVHECVEGRV